MLNLHFNFVTDHSVYQYEASNAMKKSEPK